MDDAAGLEAALETAVTGRGRFQQIDISLPHGVVSTTLARFVSGVRR